MPTKRISDKIRPIYRRKNTVYVLDQLALPHKVVYRALRTPAQVADAIRRMVLRGAPLIGCAAAYGYALAAKSARYSTPAVRRRLLREAKRLLNSRPTAVNLAWGIRRMKAAAKNLAVVGNEDFYQALLREADAVAAEDIETNLAMAEHGAKLLPRGARVMTICNTGALATAGVGTALGVIRRAYRKRGLKHVYACETRPYLQGARLTMWELLQERIPSTLITDNMAAHLMKTERIDAVLAGADRIAANCDSANKIGTYGLAILAKAHRIPFYIVAPSSTVDLKTRTGRSIPIEERSPREVVEIRGRRIAPKGIRVRNPAFDVTPARLITAVVTEKGVVRPASRRRLKAVLDRRPSP
ncbi:MAG: S-methyl-5-thioribose-1-phosphate isomerase [Elusimicrobiota bacterium]